MTDVTQTSLLCPGCAGQRIFDPVSQGLTCLSCGTQSDLAQPDDDRAAEEFPYDPEIPCAEPEVIAHQKRHHCETCGGDVVFVGPALSERCPYCDGPVVIGDTDTGYAAMALIPFQADQSFAETQARAWASARWAAPRSLSVAVEQGKVSGLYAPFWTFDSDEIIRYWATYTVRSGKNTRMRNTTGRLKMQFNDVLVPASPHVTPLIRDGILHEFDPYSLKPYAPAYLSGFAAERHHQTVPEGLEANERDKDLLIRNRIKSYINKSGVRNIRYRTDTSGIHYRRILLPVWILHYTFQGKPMKIVVSGIDGRTFGERPFSLPKLVLLSGLISTAALALGWIWSLAGGL